LIAETEAVVRTWAELAAIAAGAASGALHAQRREYDLIGILVVGTATGLGGGIIRDVLLSEGPVLALRHGMFIVLATSASLLAAVIPHWVRHLSVALWTVDSLALGLFAVTGVQRGIVAGLEPAPLVTLGIMTSVGGGMIRDVLCREVPAVLVPGEPQASAAMLAAIVYVTLIRIFGQLPAVAELAAVAAVLVLRTIALRRGWRVPLPPDLSRGLRRKKRA
jgi:uncharacterized membrane protein YeiH